MQTRAHLRSVGESKLRFASRKKEHIRLFASAQASESADFARVKLIHEALPEMDLEQVDSSRKLFGRQVPSPFFVSSMTGGHEKTQINARLAEAAQERGWPMGVGSQRRDLFDSSSSKEWKQLRKRFPKAVFLGNLGLAQVIRTPISEIEKLVDTLEAQAFFVHLNSLQEALQVEGTPHFAGGFRALENLSKKLSVPVIVKEVGCGISKQTLKKLNLTGVFAVDVAGLGGTHWGRVETQRSPSDSLQARVGEHFANWGLSTMECLLQSLNEPFDFELWASGGVRSGVDAGKLLALGARMIGIAAPLMSAALKDVRSVMKVMQEFEETLKVVQFCTGARTLQDLRSKGVWYESKL